MIRVPKKVRVVLFTFAVVLVLGIAVLPLIPGKSSKQDQPPPKLSLPYDFLMPPVEDLLSLEPYDGTNDLETQQLMRDLDEAIRLKKEEEQMMLEIIEMQKELERLYELEKLRRKGKLWSA